MENGKTLSEIDDLDYLKLKNNRGLLQLFASFSDSEEYIVEYSRQGAKCRPPLVTKYKSLNNLNMTHDPPTPGCIVISNLALYFFPPEQTVENISFVPLISYERYTWDELEFISLPYNEKINEFGEEYAARMDDLVLHFVNGATLWLQAYPGGRSELVQVISDSFKKICDNELDLRYPQHNALVLQLKTSYSRTSSRSSLRIIDNEVDDENENDLNCEKD